MQKKNILTAIIILAVFGLGVFVFSAPAQADDALSVTSVKRITPPEYRASNSFYGERDWGIWSKNNTHMMIIENSHDKHPVANEWGRGIVWGAVEDFKSWTDLTDYKNKIVPLPSGYASVSSETSGTGALWSKFDNNEIYVATRSCGLYKIDFDTKAVTFVISLDPNDTTPLTPTSGCNKYSMLHGWTQDNNIIISFTESYFPEGGWEIDVQAPSRTWIATPPWDDCSEEYRRWPDFYVHGHASKSPSGNLFYEGAGYVSNDGVKDLITCTKVFDRNWENQDTSYPWTPSHVSWKASENWLLMNSYSSTLVDIGTPPGIPTITPYKLWQVFFDGTNFTYNELLSQDTAHRWDDGVHYVDNYQSHFMATLRKDGGQALFTSTNGKYSYADCNDKPSVACPSGWASDTWGLEGFFLVDLAPANTNPADVDGSGSVNIKDIQACIKVITNSQTNQTIVDNCKNLVSDTPVNVMNIKDIQKIVQAIVNPN